MARVPPNVLLLAAVSLLADISGEMLMAVLPFLLVAQGAGGLGLGLVGGAADAVGHLVKPFAGAFSDRTRRRKPLIAAGYVLAAVSRLGIALAAVWQLTFLFRSADRVGKGLRTAPRDALLAESVQPSMRGRAFGFHRAADTAGAFLGVSFALAMLIWFRAASSTIVFVGALIGLMTIVPLFFVREVDASTPAQSKAAFEPTSPQYRRFLWIAGVFALGNVSYVFYLIRAREAVGGEVGAVALYLLFNLVYAVAAYPAGHLADRIGRPRVLLMGFVSFAMSAAIFLLPPRVEFAFVGFALLGVAFASVDGVERAFAADLAGSDARSTRLGVFSAVVGLATVAGGVIAGLLWDIAPAWTFAWGVALPIVAAVLLAGVFGFRRDVTS